MKYVLPFFCVVTQIFAQNYDVASIPESLKKNANVVVRSHTTEYFINSIDNMEVKQTEVKTIMNRSGDDQAKVFIPYSKSEKVSNIKVTLYNASGKELKTYGKRDFSDYSHTPSFGLYVDNRILVLDASAADYPYTIKVSYTTNTPNTAFIGDFYPTTYFNQSVENITRKFYNKSGIKLNVKSKDTDLGKVQKSEAGDVWEYSYQNFQAIDEERYTPSILHFVPKVEFALQEFNLEGKKGSLDSMKNFGKWYYDNLLNPASLITPELKQEVEALGLTGTTEEKVKKIYQYMQTKTRYVFVSMGIGGWQPMAVEEVRQKGYGDCKALTNYMRAMLEVAGIPSYYCIIWSDRSPKFFDENFLKMDGNHVVLMVPDGDKQIWLENTSQTIAFNHLSPNTTDRNVQAVSKDGMMLIKTPVYPASQNREQIKANIKLTAEGGTETMANFEYSGGQYDFMMRLVGKTNKEISDDLKDYYGYLKINKAEVKDFENNKNDAKISFQFNFNTADYCKKLGEDLFFPVMPFAESGFNTSVTERNLPFETPFAYQDEYEIRYTAPAGYKFVDIPQDKELSSEFGTYKLSFEKSGEDLIVKRALMINKGIHPKEKYAKYLEFRKKNISYDNTKILMAKSNLN